MPGNRLSDRGFTSTRGLSYTIEATATNVDAALPASHGLGAVPSSLELWVEQGTPGSGEWEKHDAGTYLVATATSLVAGASALAETNGGPFPDNTNIRIVAAAGAVALSVAEASASQAGIVSTGTQTFGGAKTFSGAVSTDASHLGGYGLLPVGAIVAYNPGYYTNGSNGGFAISGPAGNSVAQVNAFLNGKGWYVCDGAALNNAASPIWNAAGRYLPNLDDGRFLRGSTTAGTQGGSATASIAHTHTFTSNTSSVSWASATVSTSFTQPSFNKNVMNSNQTAHSHTQKSGGANAFVVQDIDNYDGIGSPNRAVNSNSQPTTNFEPGTDTASVTWASSTVTTSGGAASFNKTVLNTNQTAHDHTGTTDGASVTSISIEPQYLNTFYIVRVF